MTRKSITESPNEPEIIAQLRGIITDKQYKSIKDPITNKKIKVDLTSAHTIVTVYDKLGHKNQAQYVKKSIPKMTSIAFKLMK